MAYSFLCFQLVIHFLHSRKKILHFLCFSCFEDIKLVAVYLILQISYTLQVMPAVISLMKNDAMLITLIKPQFEAHRSQVRGNIIFRAYVHNFHVPGV